MKNRPLHNVFYTAAIFLFSGLSAVAQIDSDGAMRIFHYTDYFYTNNNDEGGTDEHTWYYYRREAGDARGNGNGWNQAICEPRNCGGGCYGYPGWGDDYTYWGTTVPTQFRMRGRYWEDDHGGRCSYDTHHWYHNHDDDYNNWEQQYNVRQGCPYVWTYYGWRGSFWRNVHYTRTYYTSPRPDYARANGSTALSICGPGWVTLSSSGRQCSSSRYYWYIAGGAYLGNTTGTLSVYVSGTTTYRVYTNDQGANSYSYRDVTVTVNNPPTAYAGADVNQCGTGSFTQNDASASGSSLSYSWSWTPSSGSASLSGANTLDNWVLTPTANNGSGTLTLTVSSPGCPNATDSRVMTWDRQATGSAGPTINQCFTGSLSAISMSGASINGYGESATGTWSTQGGTGTGNWSQNPSNPAAATFTPTSNSGSRTMRLRVQSTSGNCNGQYTDYTRTVNWSRLNAYAGPNVSQCNLNNITTSGATITGVHGGYYWTYSPISGSATINNTGSLTGCYLSALSASGSGTMVLHVTGVSPCSNITRTKSVEWSSDPLANAGPTLSVCSGSGTAIPMTGATGGGLTGNPTWSGGAGLGTWTSGGSDPSLWTFTPNGSNPSGSFTATLTVVGISPCSGTVTDTRVVRWAAPPTVTAGGTINSCNGTDPVALSGAAVGGSNSGFSWTVVSGGGSFINGGANPAAWQYDPPSSSGTAVVRLTVTGNSWCAGTNPSATRTINWGTLSASSVASLTSCGNTDNFTMSGTASGSFSSLSWSGQSGGNWVATHTTDPNGWVFDPTATSGSFNALLTVTGSGACIGQTATSVTNVDWDAYPTVEAGSAIEVCTGAGVPIAMGSSPSAGGQYGAVSWATQSAAYGAGNWTNGGSNPDNWTFTPTTPEGYIVASLTVSGNGNCAGTNVTDTRTIQWSAAPVISSVTVTDQTDCNAPNGTIVVVATGNGPLQYSSDNGATFAPLDTILGIELGSYNVVVTDTTGCSTSYASNPVSVGGPVPVTASSVAVTANNVCAGATDGIITLSGVSGGGGGPYSYSLGGGTDSLWIDIITDPVPIDSLPSASFDIVIADQFGCQSVVYTRTVSEPSPVVFSSMNVADVVGCGSSGTGSITASASGGTGALNYYLNGALNSPATSGSWPGLPGGSYEVMVQDANGCQAIAQAQINAPWTVTAGNDRYKCGSGAVSLDGEIIGALPTDCTPTCSSNCGIPNHCGAQGAAYYAPYMWIDRVRINTLDYYWTGANGYANYTNSGSSAATTDLAVGSTNQLYVRVRKQYYGWPMYTSVYFDWNRDGDFSDAGENIYMGYDQWNSVWNVYANITVPAWASLGDTRMRVWTTYYSWGNTPANGCGTKAYGEVEDYRVTITGAPTNCNPTYSWSPSGGNSLSGSVNPSSTSTYTLTVNDGAGCVQSDQVTVHVSGQTTSAGQQNVDCFGSTNGCVTLNPTNGIQPYLMYGPSNTVKVFGGSMRPITVNNTSGVAYSNHPVKMTIPFSAGMRADFGNLRFYDANQTKLSYWIESYSLSSSAVVWVKMATLPAGNSTIYMTFGDVSVTTESEGDDVFEFFDDFNSFDASKWVTGTIAATSGTNWSFYGGKLIGGNTNRTFTSQMTFSGSRINEARTYESSSAVNGFSTAGFWSATSNCYNTLNHNGTNYIREDGAWPNFGGWGNGQRNTWMREYVRANGASSRVERRRETGGVIARNDNNSGLTNERVRLGARGDNYASNQNFSAQWDWLFVRPYISSEPTITLGAVQTSDNTFCGFGVGTYNFHVVDVAGCNNSVNVAITQPAAPLSVSISMTEVGCYVSNDGTIDLTVSGGTQASPPPPYYHNWAGPSGFSSTIEDPSGLAPGVYNVTVADDNACTSSSSITVTQLSPLNPGFYTWKGSANTLWQIDDNWDCRTPDASSRVIIPGTPIGGNTPEIQIGVVGDVYDIEIQGNTSDLLDIHSGGLLRIHLP